MNRCRRIGWQWKRGRTSEGWNYRRQSAVCSVINSIINSLHDGEWIATLGCRSTDVPLSPLVTHSPLFAGRERDFYRSSTRRKDLEKGNRVPFHTRSCTKPLSVLWHFQLVRIAGKHHASFFVGCSITMLGNSKVSCTEYQVIIIIFPYPSHIFIKISSSIKYQKFYTRYPYHLSKRVIIW